MGQSTSSLPAAAAASQPPPPPQGGPEPSVQPTLATSATPVAAPDPVLAKWAALHRYVEHVKQTVIQHAGEERNNVPVMDRATVLALGEGGRVVDDEHKLAAAAVLPTTSSSRAAIVSPPTWLDVMNEAVFLDCLKCVAMDPLLERDGPGASLSRSAAACDPRARCEQCRLVLTAPARWLQWVPGTDQSRQLHMYVERRSRALFPSWAAASLPAPSPT
jgi:hypothetical protein